MIAMVHIHISNALKADKYRQVPIYMDRCRLIYTIFIFFLMLFGILHTLHSLICFLCLYKIPDQKQRWGNDEELKSEFFVHCEVDTFYEFSLSSINKK